MESQRSGSNTPSLNVGELGAVIETARHPELPDVFASGKVATWSQVFKDTKHSPRPTLELEPEMPDESWSRRVSVHPVTMEPMIELPRATSLTESELSSEPEDVKTVQLCSVGDSAVSLVRCQSKQCCRS